MCSLLAGLRSLATVGTRLALSLATIHGDADHPAHRQRFRAMIEALGEPARNDLTSEDAAELLATRWREVEVSERSQRAGFVVAAPAWEPALEGAPPTASHLARRMERP